MKGDVDYEKNKCCGAPRAGKDKGHKPRAALCKVLLELLTLTIMFQKSP